MLKFPIWKENEFSTCLEEVIFYEEFSFVGPFTITAKHITMYAVTYNDETCLEAFGSELHKNKFSDYR